MTKIVEMRLLKFQQQQQLKKSLKKCQYNIYLKFCNNIKTSLKSSQFLKHIKNFFSIFYSFNQLAHNLVHCSI